MYDRKPPSGQVVPQLSESPAKSNRIHLDYLDGLRGIAAVYVFLGHIYVALRFFSENVVIPAPLLQLLSVLNTGQFMVDVFIVLSGYCLMLPVVRLGGALRGGFSAYIFRRATRILPPYYAALVISLLVTALLNYSGLVEQPSFSDFRFDVLLSHLFLFHNWSEAWNHAIDPPMWSVAAEWQIYFIFPIVLLPVWRRFGTLASTLSGFAIGYAPHFLLDGFLDWSFPWFVGLFALGMAGAVISFSSRQSIATLRRMVPWGWLALIVGLGIVGYCAVRRGWYGDNELIADPIIGVAIMSLLVFCTDRSSSAERPGCAPVILRALSSAWAVGLGKFSYSVYLIHYPLMVLFWHILMRLELDAVALTVAMYAVGFPLIMGQAYLFHVAFERRFMGGDRQGRLRPAVPQRTSEQPA